MHPTANNWDALTSTTPENFPFDHYCHRGEQKVDPLQEGYGCINAIEHGNLSTRLTNEDRKKCTYSAKCLCPGHGVPSVKCIFTHPNGTPMPCRNQDNCVPICTHNPRCF
jgi:hypothetical protein